MSSIAKPTTRSKKTKRLGPVRVIWPDRYETFDVDGKVEGLEETLTRHRLGVFPPLGESFKPTNCLESINAEVKVRCVKIDYWVNSSQRHRWLVAALLDNEPRRGRVKGYRHLPKLRDALQRDLKINGITSTKVA